MSGTEGRRVSGPVRAVRSARAALRNSLVVRLAASFTALSVLVVVLTAAVVYTRTRALIQEALLDRLESIADDKQGELNLLVEHQQGDLTFLASLPELRQEAARLAADPEGTAAGALRAHITAKLDSARTADMELEELFLLAALGGRVLASTNPGNVGDYRVDDPYFGSARQRLTVTNVYTSPRTGRPTLTVAVPVAGSRGPVAVLAGHLDLTRIDAILARRDGTWMSAEAYLVTTLNDFVSAERFGRPEARRGVHTHGVREALAGRNGSALYTGYHGQQVLGAWRWIPERQLALMVEITAAEAFAPARKMLWTVLATGFIASLVLGVGTWLLTRRVTRPVLSVADAAVRVADGDFEARAPVATQDEVGILARTFNAMTDRVQRLVDNLSEQVEETRRANRMLEENQHLLHAVVDNSANLIMALDAEVRFLLVNQHFTGLFGKSEQEVLGRAPDAVLPLEPGRTITGLAQRVIEDRRIAEQDLDVRVGHVVLRYRVVAFPLREADRPAFGVGMIGVDLSDRRRAEAERRRLEYGVAQAQKLESLGRLAGGIAQELHSIVAAIVANGSVLLERLEHGSPAWFEVERVVAAADRAARLTRQMRSYADHAATAIETLDLNSVIEELGDLLNVVIPGNVRFERELAPGLPPVRADRTQLSQLVLNLVSNAAEAMEDRGGRVLVRTSRLEREQIAFDEYRLACDRGADVWVSLEVRDEGAGMAAEAVERIFDPFYTTKGAGHGLGLVAVLSIVRQAGGTLRVVSSPGAGTTFTVLLPTAGLALTDSDRARAWVPRAHTARSDA